MLTIFGFLAISVCTIQVYKTASGTDRSAPAWAAITAITGIALQFVLPVILSLVIAVVYMATGTSPEDVGTEIYGFALVIGILGLVLSVVGMYMVMKYVSRVKDDEPAARTPPPPPTFGGGQ